MINEVLKLVRIMNGYKAIDLAKKLEISQSYLSAIENNKKTPNMEILKKYSEIFNVPVSALMFFSEELERDRARGIKKEFSRQLIRLSQIIKSINML